MIIQQAKEAQIHMRKFPSVSKPILFMKCSAYQINNPAKASHPGICHSSLIHYIPVVCSNEAESSNIAVLIMAVHGTKWKSYESCFLNHQSGSTSIEGHERTNYRKCAARLVHVDADLGMLGRNKLSN